LLSAGVTVLGLTTQLALTPAVQAHSEFGGTYYVYRFRHCFHVYYRPCRCDPWACYGSYHCRCDAEAAASALRAQGFRVMIRG
jgi:hypothetical protein